MAVKVEVTIVEGPDGNVDSSLIVLPSASGYTQAESDVAHWLQATVTEAFRGPVVMPGAESQHTYEVSGHDSTTH